MGPLVGCLIVLPVVLLLAIRLYLRRTVRCVVKDRLDGKTVIVTGASSGIGREVALECAARGAKVVLGCRNSTKAEAVTAYIKRKTSSNDVHYIVVDMSSMASVKQFVDIFYKQHDTVDVLVNNAGYMGPKMTTADGFDHCFQVNFLSHFCLTNLIIRRRLATTLTCDRGTGTPCPAGRPLRVVNVASDAYSRGRLDWDEIAGGGRTSKTVAEKNIYDLYANSKLAMMLFTTEVNFRHSADGVLCLATHPGAVRTGILNNWPGLKGRVLRLAASLLFRNPEEGAQSVIYCIVQSDRTVLDSLSGSLVVDCHPVTVQAPARAYKDAERLWATAIELCRLNNEPSVIRKRSTSSTTAAVS